LTKLYKSHIIITTIINKGGSLLMPEEFKAGCQRPPIKKVANEELNGEVQVKKEEKQTMIKVGRPAPDFTAPAFFKGKFMNVSLSEYKDKWVLLCFYPGDFTFV
jgi:hypothetical protein